MPCCTRTYKYLLGGNWNGWQNMKMIHVMCFVPISESNPHVQKYIVICGSLDRTIWQILLSGSVECAAWNLQCIWSIPIMFLRPPARGPFPESHGVLPLFFCANNPVRLDVVRRCRAYGTKWCRWMLKVLMIPRGKECAEWVVCSDVSRYWGVVCSCFSFVFLRKSSQKNVQIKC